MIPIPTATLGRCKPLEAKISLITIGAESSSLEPEDDKQIIFSLKQL